MVPGQPSVLKNCEKSYKNTMYMNGISTSHLNNPPNGSTCLKEPRYTFGAFTKLTQ